MKCQEVEFSQSHCLFGTPCQFHRCAYQSQTKMKQVHEYLKISNIYKLNLLQYLKNFKCSMDKFISINVIA
jgi:hypothetical protein